MSQGPGVHGHERSRWRMGADGRSTPRKGRRPDRSLLAHFAAVTTRCATSGLLPRLARVAGTIRRAVVEEPGQDAHVVVREIAEDEVRGDAATGAEAGAVGVGAAPPGGAGIRISPAGEGVDGRLPRGD